MNWDDDGDVDEVELTEAELGHLQRLTDAEADAPAGPRAQPVAGPPRDVRQPEGRARGHQPSCGVACRWCRGTRAPIRVTIS